MRIYVWIKVEYKICLNNRRYNTSVPGSDVDFVAVIKYPVELMCGLSPMNDILKNPEDSKYDYSVHVLIYMTI